MDMTQLLAGLKVDLNIRSIRSKLGDYASHIVFKPGYGYYFE